MNQQERDALREKHNMTVDYDGDNFCGYCVCFYPCDVIKVLDATEPDPNCDHIIGKVLKGVYFSTTPNQDDVRYCPQCGEKL
jgi:hypothetical protein